MADREAKRRDDAARIDTKAMALVEAFLDGKASIDVAPLQGHASIIDGGFSITLRRHAEG